MNEVIATKVKEILAEQLGLEVGQIKLTDRLLQDLGADSMDVSELIMELEESFETDISDEEAEKLLTVGDIVTWLTENAE